jgi:hypothetical protein
MGQWYVGLGEIVVCWVSEYGGWFGLWLCVIFTSGVTRCCRMNWKEYCFFFLREPVVSYAVVD